MNRNLDTRPLCGEGSKSKTSAEACDVSLMHAWWQNQGRRIWKGGRLASLKTTAENMVESFGRKTQKDLVNWFTLVFLPPKSCAESMAMYLDAGSSAWLSRHLDSSGFPRRNLQHLELTCGPNWVLSYGTASQHSTVRMHLLKLQPSLVRINQIINQHVNQVE